MRVRFLDLSRQIASVRGELDAAVASVVDAGRFVLGEHLAEFEQAFAAWCGAREAVGVASGTDALAIALRSVGVEAGDEVIVPANTCAPTVAGIEATGALPVLADVDPHTWTLDPNAAAAAVTRRTRAIVPVHLYGLCADVDALRSLGVKIVEDAAQAHGAALRGRRAGTLGDAAAFSFYPTKNLGALGDGGAVVTDDPQVAERARTLRVYGERRRAIAGRYDELELPAQREPDGYLHARHLYVVRSAARDTFRCRLESREIETLVHYPRAVHQHPAYRRLARGGLGESERLAAEVVSLPLYPELADEEVEAVVEALA